MNKMKQRTFEMMKKQIWTFLEVLGTTKRGRITLANIAIVCDQILKEDE
tara:strand:- start:4980 stop:5126 length:147 start_codon:yes stop_codon:yes gene_type:complete